VPKGAAPVQRLEIFTGAGLRRAWTTAQKTAIVAERFEDGALVSHVVRRHFLTQQQLFNWCRHVCRRRNSPRSSKASIARRLGRTEQLLAYLFRSIPSIT
jgi:transposase-like protein